VPKIISVKTTVVTQILWSNRIYKKWQNN